MANNNIMSVMLSESVNMQPTDYDLEGGEIYTLIMQFNIKYLRNKSSRKKHVK